MVSHKGSGLWTLDSGGSMNISIIILTGLAAGVLVNWAADAVPGRHSLRASWRWPLVRVRDGASRLWSRPKPSGSLSTAPDPPPLTWRHGIVWIAAPLLLWLTVILNGVGADSVLFCFYAWFFLTLTVIDVEHRIVPNRMLLVALPVALLGSWVSGLPGFFSGLAGGITGFGLFLLLALAWPGAMGMGDVKLAGFIGLITGLPGIFVALVVCIFAGGLGGLLVLLRHRFQRGHSIAYAPYLALGAWVTLHFGDRLWQMYVGAM